MGRHSAPESLAGTASVVRMFARHARSRIEVHAKVPVELVASGAVDDLTLITADDQLLDCIAAGQGDVFTMPHDFSAGFPAGSLAPLLATWRSQIVDPQWPSMPTAEQAQEAVRADRRAGVTPTRRALRPMLGVAIAISALLFGSAAAGAQSAKPGDALWPLTRVLYAERADSYAAKDAAGHSLASASNALSSGDPTSAMSALEAAGGEIKKVRLPELTKVKQSLELAYETLLSRASDAGTSSAHSSGGKIAVGSQPADGASASLGNSATRVTPTSSKGSTGNASSTATTGTTPSRASIPGAPITQNPSRPPTTSRPTAPSIAPVNPTDAATTPTGPAVPPTSSPNNPPIPTDPGTSGPGSSDPGTPPATSNPANTGPSTTSVIPTPTPTTPTPTTPDTGTNVSSIPTTSVASP